MVCCDPPPPSSLTLGMYMVVLWNVLQHESCACARCSQEAASLSHPDLVIHLLSYVPTNELSYRRIGSSSSMSADTNITTPGPVLPARVPKALDREMDRKYNKMAHKATNGVRPEDTAGISVANKSAIKEVVELEESLKRSAKRRSRKSAVKEEEDDSDTPLVSPTLSYSCYIYLLKDAG